jgi:extradiol dioxygenase family protein
MDMLPFHLAFPVTDLEATRRFYVEVLGCRQGRQAERWIDFDLEGHQISAHLAPAALATVATSMVDGKPVPVPHFGLVLEWTAWHDLASRLRDHGVAFIIEPYIRFKGEVGEQATMFFRDPSGNHLEIKAFFDRSQIFAH